MGKSAYETNFISQESSIYTVFQLTRSINLGKQGCILSGTYSMFLILYVCMLYSSSSPPRTLGVKSITWNIDLTNSWQKDITQRIKLVLVWHLHNYLVQCSPSLHYFPSIFLQRLMASDQIGRTLP